MKIGIVCPYDMFQREGGVAQLVVHLADDLRKRGHIVKVITPRPVKYKDDVPKDYILLGTTRDFKGGFGTEGNWGMPADSEDIRRVLAEEQFDVINFHEPWAPILTWQILKESKTAHVATFHANLIDNVAGKSWVNVFLPYGRGIGQKMDLMTAVSPAPAQLLISRASSEKELQLVENIKYIANGINLAAYQPCKKRKPLNGPGTKTIVYIGRLDKRKGIEWLVRAFSLINKRIPEAHLVIAGKGSRLSQLEQLIEDLEIKNVHFTGYISDDEKRHLLGNADLACFPSLFGESFGIVLVEAMAMGTPLLAGNNMGYMNVMKGFGKIGLVDPKATEDFANRIEVFLTNLELRKMMIDWALKEVKQYSYPLIVDQYEAAYKEAISLKAHHNKLLSQSPAKTRRVTKLTAKLSFKRN